MSQDSCDIPDPIALLNVWSYMPPQRCKYFESTTSLEVTRVRGSEHIMICFELSLVPETLGFLICDLLKALETVTDMEETWRIAHLWFAIEMLSRNDVCLETKIAITEKLQELRQVEQKFATLWMNEN